ncbi:MAG TPA: DUF1579 domain-containing protein [Gemmataceae bacterium]
MKKIAVLVMVAAVLAGGGVARAQEAPKPPTPQKEHQWLAQLEGEWECTGEGVFDPNQPPVKSTATENVRSIGGFWTVSEVKGECMGGSFTGLMTLGYDSKKKKYVGTWVCSGCDCLWEYEGTLDPSGKVLTLETEGPCPMTGKVVKMRDVIELKDKDHKVMTSLMLGEDGKWVTFMTISCERKK